jgi:dolichol-phosphate mannosyltransferase
VKRVIVSGASGFVGANLARRLLRDGHEVHLLLRPGRPQWRLAGIQADVRALPVDLVDREAVARALAAARADWIFHLAAYGAYSSQVDARRIVETNLIGTMNLLEAGQRAGFEAFVNTGSSSEYGFKDVAPAETARLEPNSDYAVAKAAATLYCESVARRGDLPISTLRLYSVYGPFEEPTRLIPTLVTRALRRELPPLVDPSIARDFVYVDDATEAYVQAARQRARGVFNVGTGVQTTLRDLVDLARRLFGVAAEPTWGSMAARGWDTTTWVANPERIRAELGWRAGWSLEAGLVATADWLRRDREMHAFYQEEHAAPS